MNRCYRFNARCYRFNTLKSSTLSHLSCQIKLVLFFLNFIFIYLYIMKSLYFAGGFLVLTGWFVGVGGCSCILSGCVCCCTGCECCVIVLVLSISVGSLLCWDGDVGSS